MKTILSLFDYSGNWPKYYREAGYNVLQVDIKLDIDILELSPKDLPDKIHGILAAPPCTDFAGSGAQYWPSKDQDGRTGASLQLVDKTLELINYYKPEFWALENPVGRLQKLRPELGDEYHSPQII
jgi:site-specific DNA-cytosine methylase